MVETIMSKPSLSLFDKTLVLPAIIDAIRKLDPRQQ
jgi:hypothetical protein